MTDEQRKSVVFMAITIMYTFVWSVINGKVNKICIVGFVQSPRRMPLQVAVHTGKTVENHVHFVEVLCIYFETSQNGNCSVYISIVQK